MLNKIRTELEILGSKVDHVAAKIFSKVFTLKADTGKLAGNKGFYVVVFS
jgi:hypothetical protein